MFVLTFWSYRRSGLIRMYNANQLTGFYMKRNTGLKWVNVYYKVTFKSQFRTSLVLMLGQGMEWIKF